MKFTKMHGCGNDYVYVNCLEEKINNPNKVAKFISDRHFGIGSDGMICICPSDKADFRMAMYNSDGSEGAMCGNGVRCIAKYVYDYGLTDKTTITIETKGGIKELDLTVEDGKVTWVKVDMEAPITKASQIPAIYDDLDEVIDQPVIVDGKEYNITQMFSNILLSWTIHLSVQLTMVIVKPFIWKTLRAMVLSFIETSQSLNGIFVRMVASLV